MKKWLASASIAIIVTSIASVSPSAAQQGCEPVIEISQDLIDSNIPSDRVLVSFDVGFVNDYHKAAMVKIPTRAEPIGMIAVVLGDTAVVGLIENSDAPCVRFKMRIPAQLHTSAVSLVKKGV